MIFTLLLLFKLFDDDDDDDDDDGGGLIGIIVCFGGELMIIKLGEFGEWYSIILNDRQRGHFVFFSLIPSNIKLQLLHWSWNDISKWVINELSWMIGWMNWSVEWWFSK